MMGKDRSRIGKANRIKGRAWEQEVCRRLRTIKGVDAKRRLEYQEGSYDIDCNLPFKIQCKISAKPPRVDTILNTMFLDKLTYNVVITKRDRCKAVVGMYLDDWLDLIKEWNELKNL
jgi:hypothetical protein